VAVEFYFSAAIATWLTLTGSNRQHRRPFYVAVLHVAERAISVCQSVRRRARLDMGFCGLGEERADVLASIGGHATQFTLLVKMLTVVEARHVTEMNAGNGANPAAIECFQCRRDEFAGWREEHCPIRLAGQTSKIAARPRRAQLTRLPDVVLAAGDDPYVVPVVQCDLDDDMRRTAEADQQLNMVRTLGARSDSGVFLVE